jgi:hypothetical protein
MLDQPVVDRERRDLHVSTGVGVVWRARRVEVDPTRRCMCGGARRVVFERRIATDLAAAQWIVVAEVCDSGCAELT